MDKRKQYTAEKKIKILRTVFEDGQSIGAAAEKYGFSPNNIFKWRKQLFENRTRLFEIKRDDTSQKAEARKVVVLEERLRQKDEVIAELAEELLGLKKERYPQAGRIRIISDNGSRFIAKDFQELLVLLEVEHTFTTSANHPQYNRKLGCFNRTIVSKQLYYNSQQMHSAIWYLTPDDVFYGKPRHGLRNAKKMRTLSICVYLIGWQNSSSRIN
jgi:transposase-like protein